MSDYSLFLLPPVQKDMDRLMVGRVPGRIFMIAQDLKTL